MQKSKQRKQTTLKRKGLKNGQRRYPTGRYPIYDQTYDQNVRQSPILNPSKAVHNNIMSGIGSLQTALIQLIGVKDGYYKDESDAWHKALIPSAEEMLKRVHKEFKIWQKKQVREGHSLKPPKEYPENILEKRLKSEATLDIRLREKIKVEKIIDDIKEQQRKDRNEGILVYGPKAEGIMPPQPSLRREWLVDGQLVTRNPKGIPYIDEPDSPYNGMPLVHYREMSKKWLADRKQRIIDQWEYFVDSSREGYRHKESGKTVSMMAFAGIKKGNNTKVSKDELPDWPEDAKPITELTSK